MKLKISLQALKPHIRNKQHGLLLYHVHFVVWLILIWKTVKTDREIIILPDPLCGLCVLFSFNSFTLHQLLQFTFNIILLKYFNNALQGAAGTPCILKPNFIVHL